MQQYFIVISTLVFAVVVSTMHSCAFATTYYVAVTGSGSSNSGTQTLPLLTPQKAANIVKPGDTIIVGDGTYTTLTSQ